MNPAADLDTSLAARVSRCSEEAQRHAWSATEARAFLQAAKAAGPQAGAFHALALDCGARKR